MPRIRTFIAAELTPAIRRAAIGLQRAFAEQFESVRWVDEANVHVTLKFLGEVEATEVPAVCRTVAEAVAGFAPFEIEVGGVGAFPRGPRPRILWIGVRAGGDELIALQGAIDAGLDGLGYRREERPFTPHATIGRVRDKPPRFGPHGRAWRAAESQTGRALAEAVAGLADWTAGTMTMTEVVVMSSELTPEGPLYTAMGRFRLKGKREA